MHPFITSRLLGLDIQPQSLRLMQLRHTRRGFLAEVAAEESLSAEIFYEGKIRDWQALRMILQIMVKDLQLTDMKTAIQIPYHLVRLQQIKLPPGLTETSIRQEIRMQLERDFPGLNEELAIDFRVRGKNFQEDCAVDFVVTRKDYITQYVNCVNAAGLKVQIVDVDLYALKRFLDLEFAADPADKHAGRRLTDQISAMIIEMNENIFLLMFSGQEILHHHQWKKTERDELFLQFSRVKNLKQIWIHTHDPLLEKMLTDYGQLEIHRFNPFFSSRFPFWLNRKNPGKKIIGLSACLWFGYA